MDVLESKSTRVDIRKKKVDMKNETDEVNRSKVMSLVYLLESTQPTGNGFSESVQSILDDDEKQIVKDKLFELINKY